MDRTATIKNKGFNYSNLKLSKIFDSKAVIFMIIGFLLSRSILIDGIAPLGLAFFLYICRFDKYKIQVFIAVLLGTLLSFNEVSIIAKYVVCASIIMIFSKKIREVTELLKMSLIGFLIVLPVSMICTLTTDISLYSFIVVGVESIIVFTSVFIFAYGIKFLVSNQNKMSIKTEEIISISLLTTFSIMGVGQMAILGVSLRSVLATIFILISAIIGGASIGSSCGVIVGLAFIINNAISAIYMGIYAFAGLIGGAFNRVNRYLCVLGYVLSWIIIFAYTSGLESNINSIRDILIGALIVSVLPKVFFERIESAIKININTSQSINDYIVRTKELTNSKLINIQRAYSELANTFEKIRQKDEIINQNDIAQLIDMVYKDECSYCSMKKVCWEVRFNKTYTLMYNMIQNLEEGQLTVGAIPEEFKKSCMNPEQIIKISNYYYKMFALNYDWSMKFEEGRKLIADQIRNISKSIKNLSDDLEMSTMLDLTKEKNLLDELERNNIIVNKLNYLTKGKNEFKITIDKNTCTNGGLCDQKLIKIISDYLGEQLSAQKYGCNIYKDTCKIVLTKAEKFTATTQALSLSRDGHVLCGDNYTYMEIDNGQYMMAICDGMGKGKRAYDESSTTIDILEKMIEARIDNEIVIKTINNMLLLSNSDEIFSTLDLGIIDLKQGRLETVKMGACSTYIKRANNDVDFISSSSLPVGILSEIKLDRHNYKLNDGDYIIMVSDGIIDAGKNNDIGENWLIYFLKKLDTYNPKEIIDRIINRAIELQLNNIEDDMTVMVTKINRLE
ncbi:MAG: stage II sporulation protein E [Intestinibacter sp.]|uniref:stage II sporulation protein E n=1 Tax=Intestinibacter sp. TaxID=1965304 RepID=UPI002A7F72FD|nr:stage II sporulation protein E [Intestinibacter sp.]MDY4573441.1 stage II sporulation protein E [Intestinibacter sp.]